MLTKEEIEKYLEELNEGLAKENVIVEVILCCGSVMTLVYDARQSTRDIDALFAPTSIIRKVAIRIAEEHSLPDDWFNDAAKGFIDTSRMNFEDVKTYSNLRVRKPGDKEMLALKLASAREDSKDAEDALFLMKLVGVETIEEVYDIIEKYIPAQRLTPMAQFFAQEIFHRYKEE